MPVKCRTSSMKPSHLSPCSSHPVHIIQGVVCIFLTSSSQTLLIVFYFIPSVHKYIYLESVWELQCIIGRSSVPLWRQDWMQFTENFSARKIWDSFEEMRVVKRWRVKVEEEISFGILTLASEGLATCGFNYCFPDCVVSQELDSFWIQRLRLIMTNLLGFVLKDFLIWV